jgi:hypothetical protein
MPDGGPLVTFRHVTGVLHASAAVEIASAAVLRRELPWLVAFGWYLVVMARQDQAAAVGRQGNRRVLSLLPR